MDAIGNGNDIAGSNCAIVAIIHIATPLCINHHFSLWLGHFNADNNWLFDGFDRRWKPMYDDEYDFIVVIITNGIHFHHHAAH